MVEVQNIGAPSASDKNSGLHLNSSRQVLSSIVSAIFEKDVEWN